MKKPSLFLTLGTAFSMPISALAKPLEAFNAGKHHIVHNNKCKTHGHIFDPLETYMKKGKRVMTGRCRRCNEVEHDIPVRTAEHNLHPQIKKKSRDHWIKPNKTNQVKEAA